MSKDSVMRWPLLQSQTALIDGAAQQLEAARQRLAGLTELAFKELAEIKGVDISKKVAKLHVEAGKVYLEVSDAQDSGSDPGTE